MSGYASIVVSLEPGKAGGSLAKIAESLATRFEARLIGVGARPRAAVFSSSGGMPELAIVEDEAELEAELLELELQFQKLVRGNSESYACVAAGPPLPFLLMHACAGDLVLLRQAHSDEKGDPRYNVEPVDVLLKSGRPALLIPDHCEYLSAKRIVVAWKDAREARRAVSAALPFLKAADEVLIVAIDENDGDDSVDRMLGFLKAHKAPARIFYHGPLREESVTDEIFYACDRANADLVVAGAYSHGPMREWLLGGVTRDLLDDSPAPCLMAH